jgi:hypothetical protein
MAGLPAPAVTPMTEVLTALGLTAGPGRCADGVDTRLTQWAAGEARSVGVAWATCPRAEWLLRIAASLGLPRREVILAAAAVVEPLHPYLSPDAEVVRALAAVARFIDGSGRSADCWAAAYGLSQRSEAMARQAEHDAVHLACLRAVAALARACDGEADEAYWSQRACVAEAAAYATAALEASGVSARVAADAVRQHLPYERVARAIRLARATGANAGRASGFYGSFDDAAWASRATTPEGTGSFGR